MPPRRNRNQAQAQPAAAAPAQPAAAAPAQPAAAEAEAAAAAQPAQEQLPAPAPPPFPLFAPGRTLVELHKKVADIEYDRAPRRSRRKVANLCLNVWDLLAAKRTGYAERGGIPDPVKTCILEFVGDAAPTVEINPQLTAHRMRGIRSQFNEKKAKEITDKILPICERQAAMGNKGGSIRFGDVVDGLIPTDNLESNWWGKIFRVNPLLKPALERAGFELRCVPIDEAGEDDKSKKQKLESLLRVNWEFE
ncbi:unnamed protein product [Amoebophrya sp. A120]|nr:unnamed protein product [Amoebophrya sp. A120]|eukprot:GSA120T00023376001.1